MTLNNPQTFSIDWEGTELSIETGRIAKQADGAVVVRLGETMVLVTAVAAHEPSSQPFLPLTVNYQQPNYAAGKFPGGFFKREGRPSEKEVLTSRLIDRPLRPLFPEGYRFETQVIATVISADLQNDSDIPAMIGASAALTISDIPWNGPVVGARVGRIDGKYVLNPTVQALHESDIDAIIVVSEESVVMVEGGASFVSEQDIVGALEFAKEKCQPVIELQKQMAAAVGRTKRELPAPEPVDEGLRKEVEAAFTDRMREAASVRTKHERYAAYGEVKKAALEAFGTGPDGEDRSGAVKEILEDLKKRIVRGMIREGVRVDGRDHKTVRPIEIETGWLPRAHGSALFTRGETQAIVTATLGTQEDEQKLDTLERQYYKRFYLHYNFPPYSVGEVRRMGSPGRREIGHGNLAERAFLPLLPDAETFPYTIRVVSEITESNGSSSMATVCGASLS
ncbi:MAG: polyribonucleotide nucleotidyltransferase, partial [Candidatus Dadabacteria bacterium]